MHESTNYSETHKLNTFVLVAVKIPVEGLIDGLVEGLVERLVEGHFSSSA